MSGTVLITGAFGLVGTDTVRRFAADGWRVVATAHRRAFEELPPRVETRWTDLTDPAQVRSLVAEVSPDVIVHLAAVIPPLVYCDAAFARRLNVGATVSLVSAASDQPKPPRLLHASSTAIYGSRNPYRHPELLSVGTPLQPCELYGGHKLEAEACVRSSGLDWVVLRLGGVLSVDPRAMPVTRDIMYFTSALPADGRVHSVDTRDVAVAFAAAVHQDVSGMVLLIG
ncbi:MAG: NAD(P)-dependent oxidoreductase, partial [Mycobacteriaceae bacterium]|nr:NAD(P)-dependent oxidoreductase [Mycobacteriaceae bacterium]